MVIKWSADVDQILLLKILEVHQISVNTKDIADKWPTHREKPTPRAISERLVKLRSIVKSTNSNAGHFAISASKPSTPTKLRAPKTPTSSVTKNRQAVTGSASARKKSTVKNEDSILASTEIIDIDDDEDGVNIKAEPTLEPETTINNASPKSIFGPGLPTPSETSSGAQSMDGANDMPSTPTPTRHMVTRGRRVRTYVTEEPESSDDSDVSDFRGGMSPASTIQGDDEEMDGI